MKRIFWYGLLALLVLALMGVLLAAIVVGQQGSPMLAETPTAIMYTDSYTIIKGVPVKLLISNRVESYAVSYDGKDFAFPQMCRIKQDITAGNSRLVEIWCGSLQLGSYEQPGVTNTIQLDFKDWTATEINP